MESDYHTILKSLRKLDRLITSNNTTVQDLLDQAYVAAEIADDDSEIWTDIGPLERMYSELQVMSKAILQLQSEINLKRDNSYENVTWTQSHTGTDQWIEPLRNYPSGYTWDPISRSAIKISRGTGT